MVCHENSSFLCDFQWLSMKIAFRLWFFQLISMKIVVFFFAFSQAFHENWVFCCVSVAFDENACFSSIFQWEFQWKFEFSLIFLWLSMFCCFSLSFLCFFIGFQQKNAVLMRFFTFVFMKLAAFSLNFHWISIESAVFLLCFRWLSIKLKLPFVFSMTFQENQSVFFDFSIKLRRFFCFSMTFNEAFLWFVIGFPRKLMFFLWFFSGSQWELQLFRFVVRFDGFPWKFKVFCLICCGCQWKSKFVLCFFGFANGVRWKFSFSLILQLLSMKFEFFFDFRWLAMKIAVFFFDVSLAYDDFCVFLWFVYSFLGKFKFFF